MHIGCFVNAHQNKRGIERDGCERISRHAVFDSILADGDDGDASREAAENLPKKVRIKHHKSLLK
jgi:hypothetical protein